MSTSKIINPTTGKEESAKKAHCPRCHGEGATTIDKTSCFVCKGKGEVMMSASNWHRPIHSSKDVASKWNG